uniref:McrC family protein n=1 Tax=Escherichia coli TaxID=562 RepID=UPI002020CC00
MGEVISVFEYDLLGSDKAASVGAKLVPPLVFNYLEALSLASNQGSQFLKLTSRSGFKLLQVQNYAGMLSTPHGFQLEILPKVGKNLTAANARQTLLTMLMKWFTEFGHLNRGDMLTSEQHRCHNE